MIEAKLITFALTNLGTIGLGALVVLLIYLLVKSGRLSCAFGLKIGNKANE